MYSRPSPLACLGPLLCALTLVFAAPAIAEEAAATSESDQETMFSLILKGGWLMWPIAICSLVALTVAFERLFAMSKARTIPTGILEEVFRQVPSRRAGRGERQTCTEMLTRDGSTLARVLRVGVLKLDRDARRVEAHLTEAVSKELHLLRRSLRPFSIVSSIAPLLGLLGTIYGMIECFSEAHAAESAQRTQVLAEGIYGALVTTATGLTVAIPALLLYHYFLGRVDRTVDQLEEGATELLDHYWSDDEEDRSDGETTERARPAPTSGAFETKS